MTEPILRAEHLGKRYRLTHASQERSSTLREAIWRGLQSLGTARARARSRPRLEEFWALDDVSFDLQAGDRLGIIGRNGAGKTTLLKILSRITAPTRGRVSLRGRVASLLEVGTGFHPELSGRENIYLNGAILGMRKAEIARKFDAIVGFAEVEKFLDTPVKRYSSGMYVRLAFAVAAHLDPEILVIDEVLAVGDAKFQQKCLGKMREVSGQGRTVLFVTHQMGMVAQLCNKALLLQQGAVAALGEVPAVVETYLNTLSDHAGQRWIRRAESAESAAAPAVYIASALMRRADLGEASQFSHHEPIVLEIECGMTQFRRGACLGFAVLDASGRKVFTSQKELSETASRAGSDGWRARITIPGDFLTPGAYSVLAALHVPNVEVLDHVDEACRFTVVDTGSEMAIHDGVDYGCVFAKCQWEIRSRG